MGEVIRNNEPIYYFENDEVKAQYLIDHGFTKSAAWGYNPIYYSGYLAEDDKVECHIVGYLNDYMLVIDFGKGEHTIHVDYLQEMNSASIVVIDEEKKYKGKRTDKLLNDYTMFDIETTGLSITTDSILEIAALKVRNNEVVETFETFVKPSKEFRENQVSKITNEMVKDAPNEQTAIDMFLDFVKDDVLIGFNNSTFDLPFLAFHSEKQINNQYSDTLLLARKYLFGPADHKLETLKEFYKIDNKSHRALDDCYTTKEIYDLAALRKKDKNLLEKEVKEFESKPENFEKKKKVINHSFIPPNFNDITLGLQSFKKVLEEITSDSKLEDQEILDLKLWMENHENLKGNYPFDRIYESIENILEDKIITNQEKDSLLNVINIFLKPANDDDVEVVFKDKKFVKTGDFAYGSEKELKAFIEAKGGVFMDKFNQSADYVVMGEYGSPSWSKGTFGSKVEKAKKYNDSPKATHHINIITEKQLFKGENK